MLPPGKQDKAYWRERVRQVGLDGVIREEMARLGMWPPDEETARRASEAMVELRVRYDEIGVLRDELGRIEQELADAENVVAALVEIRRKRIERVRAERETRRAARLVQKEERIRQDVEWRRSTIPYLGRGVSGGLIYAGGDPRAIEAQGLPRLDAASDLAAAIGITEEELAWLTYHRAATVVDHYHRFTIPKRTGGQRVISAPKRRLRTAQGWVLASIFAGLEVHPAAAAFRPKRSILDNAATHAGRAVVVRVDLKDFFPSITFRRVKGLFESFGYNEGIATLLALITTEAPRATLSLDGQKRFVSIGERQLPQGACTSPAITNVLCRKLDRRLTGAAQSFGFIYSRYADDLVFSHQSGDAPLGALLALLRMILTQEGFTINEAKTAIMRGHQRQTVTGLVVNGEAPRLSREDLRRFRAFLHHCERDGFDSVTAKLGRNAQAYASGYLSFIHMVSPEQEERLRQRYSWLRRWEE